MAAGVTGIPCALVVDRQGIVRFVGHPAEPAFEAAIRQVIVGASCIATLPRACMRRRRPGEASRKVLDHSGSLVQALCGRGRIRRLQ